MQMQTQDQKKHEHNDQQRDKPRSTQQVKVDLYILSMTLAKYHSTTPILHGRNKLPSLAND